MVISSKGFSLIELLVALMVVSTISLFVVRLYCLSWQNSYFAASVAEASLLLATISGQQLLLQLPGTTDIPSHFAETISNQNGLLRTRLAWRDPLKPTPHQLSIDVVQHVSV